MTTDFKRLCEAAESAHEDWVKGGYSVKPGEYTIEATPEAIVRAVLMALREPSEEALAAGAVDLLRDVTDPWDCMPRQMDEAFGLDPDGAGAWGPAEERIRPHMKRAFGAMLNAILAEPAKA